jgi:hypothetical protein
MKLDDMILICPKDTGEFVLSDQKASGKTLYRKELIYPGKFWQLKGGRPLFEFEVTDSDLDHWAKTFSEMTSAGHEVPVPVEHTTDPEANRGFVRKMAKEFDAEKKRNGLYGYVEFADGHENLAHTTNVSIHTKPEFKDTQGRVFDQPIKHVALTNYPLIPGLGKFKAIVASQVDSTENPAMMQELATALGVQFSPNDDDATIMQAIIDQFGPGAGTPPTDPNAQGYTASQVEKIVLQDRKERKALLLSEGSDPIISPSLAKTVASGRVGRIKALVHERKISPAKAKQLEKRFCDSDHMELVLSEEAKGGNGDAFEEVMLTLSDLPESQPGRGELTLAQIGEGGQDPLIADAEARAKKAKR